MVDATVTDEELAELIQRTDEAASAYMRGDMERYLELVHHARGFTLLNPLGHAVVLVMTERQHGRVGGLPDQDWSLRARG